MSRVYVGRDDEGNALYSDVSEAESPQAEGAKVSERDFVAGIASLSLDMDYSDSEALAAITKRCYDRIDLLSQSQPSSLAGTFEDVAAKLDKREVLAHVQNTEYAKEQIARHLIHLTDDQKASLFRAVVSLAIKGQQSQPVIEPLLLDAINWLMGCSNDDFIPPSPSSPRYWWRSEFAKRAGLEYDGNQFRKAQKEQK